MKTQIQEVMIEALELAAWHLSRLDPNFKKEPFWEILNNVLTLAKKETPHD